MPVAMPRRRPSMLFFLVRTVAAVIWMAMAITGPGLLAQGAPAWQAFGNGLGGFTALDVEIQPGEPPTVFAVVDTHPGSVEQGLWRLTDAEGTWQRVTVSPNPPPADFFEPRVASVEIHPRDRPRLLAPSHWGLRESLDAGASWLTLFNRCLVATSVAAAPSLPGRYDLTGDRNGLCNRDGTSPLILRWDVAEGELVSLEAQDLVQPKPDGLAVDPADAGQVYAAQGDFLFLSEDAGLTWQKTDPGFAPRSLVADPLEPDVVYAGSETGVFWKSTDAGRTWQLVGTPAGDRGALQVVVDPVDPSHLYVRVFDGIFASDDGG